MLSGMHRCVVLRFVAVIAIAAMTTSWAATAMAAVPAVERIGDDSGGRIGTYLSKFEALRKSGQRVVIDGTCASACTLVVSMIPRNRICVTPRAVLAFHAAWDPSLLGAQTDKPGTKYL
jgi:hypothetical protein